MLHDYNAFTCILRPQMLHSSMIKWGKWAFMGILKGEICSIGLYIFNGNKKNSLQGFEGFLARSGSIRCGEARGYLPCSVPISLASKRFVYFAASYCTMMTLNSFQRGARR